VVAVLRQPEHGGNWEVIVIDQAPNTFVHEVEVGDIDGDGLNEIFATPSAPNKMNLKLQPGKVVMYRFDGKGWPRQIIEALEDRHAKEILLADVEGRGRPDLYAVLERSLGKAPATTAEDDNAILKRYRFTSGGFTGTVIARLPDVSCRFLNAGDVDADGQIASCGKAGIWMVKPAAGEWSLRPIDRDSDSIEHATALADLDGDGHLEIYVAADKQRKLRRYVWNGEGFDRSDLLSLAENDLTFDLTVCQNTRCVNP
jgi:hypothetical protein